MRGNVLGLTASLYQVVKLILTEKCVAEEGLTASDPGSLTKVLMEFGLAEKIRFVDHLEPHSR